VTFIVNADELPRKDSKRLTTGELLGSLANLSQATGLTDLFVHHETLAPGHRSSPPHHHSQKEELVYVLEGTPSAWIDGEVKQLRPGDAVGFPAGVSHMIFNRGSAAAKLIVVSTLLHDQDTCTFVDDDPFPSLVEKTEL
jgi:uncharacterized cupin superfamily protein